MWEVKLGAQCCGGGVVLHAAIASQARLGSPEGGHWRAQAGRAYGSLQWAEGCLGVHITLPCSPRCRLLSLYTTQSAQNASMVLFSGIPFLSPIPR